MIDYVLVRVDAWDLYISLAIFVSLMIAIFVCWADPKPTAPPKIDDFFTTGLVSGTGMGDFLTTKKPLPTLEGLEKRICATDDRVDSAERRMGANERDGNSYHARLNALEANWRALSKEIQEISARLPPAPTPDRGIPVISIPDQGSVFLRSEEPPEEPLAVHVSSCEGCKNLMTLCRTRNGRILWGCQGYPRCRNSRDARQGRPMYLLRGETTRCNECSGSPLIRRKRISNGSFFGVCDVCQRVSPLL